MILNATDFGEGRRKNLEKSICLILVPIEFKLRKLNTRLRPIKAPQFNFETKKIRIIQQFTSNNQKHALDDAKSPNRHEH